MFVTAIVQDAGLSIKIASSMLEREVVSVGSRDGLVGSACPAFVSRSALFQVHHSSISFKYRFVSNLSLRPNLIIKHLVPKCKKSNYRLNSECTFVMQ